MLNELKNDEKFEEIAKKFGICFILLFGSKAEGVDTSESDTDIAVYADHVLSEEEKISLAFELSLILETENIDLVDIKIAPPMLKRKIFENYKILYLKESSILYQIELSTLKEYEEVKILYEIRDERIKEFLIDR
ncbi:predicted nucleotidyltransferase [Thermodesulfovibrio aggregans]|uniref:Predicted nucleotidyltransferase n=1 Tax=Thermodesulfovibrio aggregans TaxID=86166 RepID=A0A0U9HTE8_9BACT|nr:nucleotidyltransferase domain-containing protein [Thermodesulfovibrio aggregans]GAQ95705.1 predicted nucleotidyltransferase [Thermodesulfovibrio aggregans]